MKADGVLPDHKQVRSSKYLNNLIGQDHRNVKARTNAMLGFKRCGNAAITIAGIELMRRMRKGQFVLPANLNDTATPAVWNAVLSAGCGGQQTGPHRLGGVDAQRALRAHAESGVDADSTTIESDRRHLNASQLPPGTARSRFDG